MYHKHMLCTTTIFPIKQDHQLPAYT
jgi:hypothetical protein